MRFKDKYLFALALYLLLLCSTVTVSALERDLSFEPINSALQKKLQKESGAVVGNYHALIIGIGDYSDRRIPDLNTPVSDATSIANILSKNYGFSEIKLLMDNDANNSKIIRELRRLATVSKEDDSVLIYYAGHGELDNITGSGWWVPYNATASDSSTYINNAIIQQYVKAIPARHVLIVADSCFSGTLLGETRDLPPIIDNKFYASLFKERSRWGMTSGNLTPVEDSGFKGHSVFAYQFIRTLQNNEKPYLTPREIYQKIAPIIRNNSEQMPVTKPIRNTNDQGGEFVFIRMAAPGFVPQMTEQDQPESVKPTSKLDPEEEMWLLVKDSNDKNDIIMFLNLYPSGKFRDHARLKLSRLRSKQKKPARPELHKLPGTEKMASPDSQSALHGLSVKQVYNMALRNFNIKDYKYAMKLLLELEKTELPPLGKKKLLGGRTIGVDNVVFWIAQCYYKLEHYQKSIEKFNVVVDKYRRGDKVIDSLYTLAFVYDALGEKSKAIGSLAKALNMRPARKLRKQIEAKIREIEKDPHKTF